MIAPELLQVIPERGKAFGPGAIESPGPHSTNGNQAGLFQDSKVLRNRWMGHLETGRDLAGRQLLLEDQPENLAAARLSNGIEDRFHRAADM